jgi:polyisoprenoid-binding protein YceI
MEQLFIFSFLTISALSLISYIKNKFELSGIIHHLFVTLILASILNGFQKEDIGTKLIGFLILISTVNWIISRIFQEKWKSIFLLITALSIAFWNNTKVSFLDYQLIFDVKNALLIFPIGIFSPILISKVKYVFEKLNFFVDSESEIENVHIDYIFIGVLSFTALFFGGTFGLFLLSLGIYISEVYLKKNINHVPFSFLILLFAFISFFINSNEIHIENIFHKSFIIGLMFGLSFSMIYATINFKSKKISQQFFVVLFTLITLFGLILMEKFKEHTGGFTAFVGIFLGITIFIYKFKNEKSLLFIFLTSAVISLGYFAKPILLKPALSVKEIEFESKFDSNKNFELPQIERKENNLNQDSLNENKSLNKVEIQNPLFGNWKINTQISKLNFELGPPEAITKGEFNKIEGTIEFNENLLKNKLKVELPLSSFTTLNDYRDETLLQKDYLDAQKQAVLTFESSKWKQKGNKYIVQGIFKMKGISQVLSIELNINDLAKDKIGDYLLISGSSQLDRTKFDMTSDPKIGDIVSFEFKLELRK